MSQQAITRARPQSIHAEPIVGSHSVLQRCSNGIECKACRQKREGTFQRAAVNSASTSNVPPIVHDVLSSSGQPLDAGTRAFMEPGFGHDFSGVRVHTDARAAESAQAVNALAYTVGRNVVFGMGQYSPGTIAGKRLLAHELTHVVQQKERPNDFTSLALGQADSAAELEAEAATDTIAENRSAHVEVALNSALVQRSLLEGIGIGLGVLAVGALAGVVIGALSGKSDAERFEEIKKVLNAIPSGKEALKVMTDYKVGVKFRAGGGSYYDQPSNSMVIDSTEATAEAALTFVHEINHAKYAHEGKTADAKTLTRPKYIEKMVEEEAEGTVKSIEAEIELEGTKIDTSKASFPLQKQYKEAYKDAVDKAKAKDPKLSEAELKKIGREAGKKRVVKGFMDGEVQTSNTHESYADYYGKYWDAVHKKSP